jgi:gluconolactonase
MGETMKAEIVADGLVWPEGPAIIPDGRVAFVETYRSQVSVWSPGQGVKRLADTGGGPNAVCLGSDGCLYVTQNGGVVGEWRAVEQRPGSIQRVHLDGRVEVVATEVDGVKLRRPNDLAFGPDGRLYFTDPGLWDPVGRPEPGYVFALDADGTGELIAEVGAVFPNGLVVEADGSQLCGPSPIHAASAAARRTGRSPALRSSPTREQFRMG